MLVSAAMAERPRATASGRSQPPPASQGPAAPRHSTARVSTTHGARSGELPGWFWGALGCMTVLVVGLSVVFFIGQTGGSTPTGGIAPAIVPASAAPAAVAPAAAPAPDVQRGQKPGIRIEPMAPPPPAIDQVPPPPPVATKPKAPVRPLKVARSPAAAPKPAVAAAKAAAESEDSAEDEPKAKPASHAAAAAQDESEEK
jgi:hypothetical protein